MESEGGEDLSWFWRGWYMNNWTLDLAVQDVRFANGGVEITIANRGRLVLPATVQVGLRDGTTKRIALSADTWIQKSAYTMHIDSKEPATSVIIDPDHVIPDSDRSNNQWSNQ